MKGIDLTQSLVTWFINEVQGILQTKKMLLFSCATRKQSFILKKNKERDLGGGEKKQVKHLLEIFQVLEYRFIFQRIYCITRSLSHPCFVTAYHFRIGKLR